MSQGNFLTSLQATFCQEIRTIKYSEKKSIAELLSELYGKSAFIVKYCSLQDVILDFFRKAGAERFKSNLCKQYQISGKKYTP